MVLDGACLAARARSSRIEIADALVSAAAPAAGFRPYTLSRRHRPMPDIESP